MLTYARWKYIVLVLAIVFSALFALPNFHRDLLPASPLLSP